VATGKVGETVKGGGSGVEVGAAGDGRGAGSVPLAGAAERGGAGFGGEPAGVGGLF